MKDFDYRSRAPRVMVARVLRAILLAAAVMVASLGSAPRAQAADGWIYLVVRDSACGTPGTYVRGILGNVQPSGWTSTQWDTGDNIIYPRVRLGVRNTANVQVMCQRKQYGFLWITVGYRWVSGSFTPTGTGQTFWIG